MVAQARGGVLSITGEEGSHPVRVGASDGDTVAGMYLTQGVLAALLVRERGGEGTRIDIGMLDSQIAIQEHAVAMTTATGVSPGPTGRGIRRSPRSRPIAPATASSSSPPALFAQLCEALGLAELATDPAFATKAAWCENHALLKRRIETVTPGAGRGHWIAVLEAAGLPTGRVQNMAEALADPQVVARNMVVDLLPDAEGRRLRTSGNPIEMTGLPDRRRGRPPRCWIRTARPCWTGWMRRPKAEASQPGRARSVGALRPEGRGDRSGGT